MSSINIEAFDLLSSTGNHACLRHHEREVFWKYQELDKEHWGGTVCIYVYRHQYNLLSLISMFLNEVSLLLIQHASSDVEKMVLGNKCDINDKRQVSKDRGEKVRSLIEVISALADVLFNIFRRPWPDGTSAVLF